MVSVVAHIKAHYDYIHAGVHTFLKKIPNIGTCRQPAVCPNSRLIVDQPLV